MADIGDDFRTGGHVPETAVYIAVDEDGRPEGESGGGEALHRGARFPPHPRTGAPVTWRLTHFAPSASQISGATPPPEGPERPDGDEGDAGPGGGHQP